MNSTGSTMRMAWRNLWRNRAAAGGDRPFGDARPAEYHYSGFGAKHPEEIPAWFTTPAFVGRFVRSRGVAGDRVSGSIARASQCCSRCH